VKTDVPVHSSPAHRGQKKAEVKKDFDPHTFNLKLTFTDEVAELGICEEDAKRL
jgi:hypothetical protein